jgi:hypothetical protein
LTDVGGLGICVKSFGTIGAGVSKDLAEHVAFRVEAVEDGQLATGEVIADVIGLGAVEDYGAMGLSDDGATVNLNVIIKKLNHWAVFYMSNVQIVN